MDLDHLALLRHELTAFQDCLSGDLTAPVEHCGDWTLRDLAEHLGKGNLWAGTAIVEGHGDHQSPPAPSEISPWFAGTARILSDALAADPAAEAWTFDPPHTVGFWRRRRCLETLVHRWDAEHALGMSSQLDPLLCGDGVAEIIEVHAPRQIQRRRANPPSAAVRFTAIDLDAFWVFGPGDPLKLPSYAPEIRVLTASASMFSSTIKSATGSGCLRSRRRRSTSCGLTRFP